MPLWAFRFFRLGGRLQVIGAALGPFPGCRSFRWWGCCRCRHPASGARDALFGCVGPGTGLFRRVGLEQVDFSAFDFAVHVCQFGDDGRDVFERVGDGLLVTLALGAVELAA